MWKKVRGMKIVSRSVLHYESSRAQSTTEYKESRERNRKEKDEKGNPPNHHTVHGLKYRASRA